MGRPQAAEKNIQLSKGVHMAHLKTGDKAPDFTLQDQDGNVITLADFKGKKLLLYFYPRASTPGCTIQACSIRDNSSQLDQLGVARIGISPDAPGKQKKFMQKQSLDFPLLCDENHTTAEDYGAWGEKSMYGKKFLGIIRSSFLIDEGGRIMQAWYKVSPAATVPNVLQALK